MPLYEYKCASCGEVFEVMQKFSDEPLSLHEECGGKVDRLLSAPALQFKGSGWYVTDYARGGNGSKEAKADGPNPAKKDTSAKTESSASSGDASASPKTST